MPDLNAFGRSLQDLLSYNQGNKFEAELAKLQTTVALIDQGDPNEAEAGVRALGELLGFTAARPNNDESTGPDVLWRDEAQPRQFGFELKTDKQTPATYYKKNISQGHDHLEWMEPFELVTGQNSRLQRGRDVSINKVSASEPFVGRSSGSGLRGRNLPHERHEKGRDEEGEHDRSECVGEGERRGLSIGKVPELLSRRHHRSPGWPTSPTCQPPKGSSPLSSIGLHLPRSNRSFPFSPTQWRDKREIRMRFAQCRRVEPPYILNALTIQLL